VKCPNWSKLLKLTPTFSSTLMTLPLTLLPKFTLIRYLRHQVFHYFPFIAIVSEPSAKNSFSQQNFKPSTHFTHIHPYILSVSIESIPSHFLPHFEFQTRYGTIHRSNAVLAPFDPCFSKSLSFCVLTLCVCIYSHFIYL
jgi:hypothetical protein